MTHTASLDLIDEPPLFLTHDDIDGQLTATLLLWPTFGDGTVLATWPTDQEPAEVTL